jgi:hypothetical protein
MTICPVESASYHAIAIAKLDKMDLADAARWLDLAEIAANPNHELLAENRKDLCVGLKMRTFCL